MKKDKLRKKRLAALKKGKLKSIGFWEGLKLKIIGRIDGSRGLPKEDENGNWTSPHIDKEFRSYAEFSTRTWGALQIEKEEEYAHLEELSDSIFATKRQLETAKAELEETASYENSKAIVRMHCEEKLTDDQVARRRKNEVSKKLAPLQNRINQLNNKISAETAEFSKLRNKIIEDNNSTRLICSRLKDHLTQRLDVYWNAAIRKHAEKSKIPILPSLPEFNINSEELYLKPHMGLMEASETNNSTTAVSEKKEVI